MGGGGQSTEYEPTRVGVDKRAYGELSKTGIQSREQYDKYKALANEKGKTQADFKTEAREPTGRLRHDSQTGDVALTADTDAYKKYTEGLGGAVYDAKWDRWKTSDGVDIEAALSDWENYTGERKEIATYGAKEARRTRAPDDLSGTTGAVDYSLSIGDKDKKKETSVGATKTYDTSSSTASTSQALGIY